MYLAACENSYLFASSEVLGKVHSLHGKTEDIANSKLQMVQQNTEQGCSHSHILVQLSSGIPWHVAYSVLCKKFRAGLGACDAEETLSIIFDLEGISIFYASCLMCNSTSNLLSRVKKGPSRVRRGREEVVPVWQTQLVATLLLHAQILWLQMLGSFEQCWACNLSCPC